MPGLFSSRSQAALVLAVLSSPFIAAYIRRRSQLYHSAPPEQRYFHHPPLPPPLVPTTSPNPSTHVLHTPHLATRLLYHLLPIPWQHLARGRRLRPLVRPAGGAVRAGAVAGAGRTLGADVGALEVGQLAGEDAVWGGVGAVGGGA